jgi:hypothetical protein
VIYEGTTAACPKFPLEVVPLTAGVAADNTDKLRPPVKAAPVASYPMLVYQGTTKISLDTIEAATVETTEKLKQLYPFYAKIGIGSVIMPLGELYFNSTRSRSNTYGAHIKHLSSFGDVRPRQGNVCTCKF